MPQIQYQLNPLRAQSSPLRVYINNIYYQWAADLSCFLSINFTVCYTWHRPSLCAQCFMTQTWMIWLITANNVSEICSDMSVLEYFKGMQHLLQIVVAVKYVYHTFPEHNVTYFVWPWGTKPYEFDRKQNIFIYEKLEPEPLWPFGLKYCFIRGFIDTFSHHIQLKWPNINTIRGYRGWKQLDLVFSGF